MNKPKHLELQEKFGQFLTEHGYEVEMSSVGYDGELNIKVTFPDGEKLDADTNGFNSKSTFTFNEERYDNFVQHARLKGRSEQSIEDAKSNFWVESK